MASTVPAADAAGGSDRRSALPGHASGRRRLRACRRTRRSLGALGVTALVLGAAPLPAQHASYSLVTPFRMGSGFLGASNGSTLQHGWVIDAAAGTFGLPPVRNTNAGQVIVPPGFGGAIPHAAGAGTGHAAALGTTLARNFVVPAGGPPFSGEYASAGTLQSDPGDPDGARLRTTSSILAQERGESASLANPIEWAPDIDVSVGGGGSVVFADRLFGSQVGSSEVLLAAVSGHVLGAGTLAYDSHSLTLDALSAGSSGSLRLFADGGTRTGFMFGGSLDLAFANGVVTRLEAHGLFTFLLDLADPAFPMRVGAPAQFAIPTFRFPDDYGGFVDQFHDGEFRLRFQQDAIAAVGAAVVPEPSAVLLTVTGLGGIAGLSLRRRRPARAGVSA